MITGRRRFNLYLLTAILAMVAVGCASHKNDKDKQLATFRMHLEAGAEDSARTTTIQLYRAKPFDMPVQKDPILTEAHVAAARVVEALGGFELQIQLNQQGTWLLQQYSASYSGRHYALFTQFGEKGKETRWLGAPQFSRIISDGLIQITPDASREEADEIVIGLNNIAKKNEKDTKW